MKPHAGCEGRNGSDLEGQILLMGETLSIMQVFTYFYLLSNCGAVI